VVTERSAGIGKRIDLVFDEDCPHVEEARRLLWSVLDEAHLPQIWREWSRQSPETPDALRGFGSPTILVDGVDVSPANAVAPAIAYALRCRVYPDGDGGFAGVPRRRDVLEALTGRK
jgi:mercuric ion transport protein